MIHFHSRYAILRDFENNEYRGYENLSKVKLNLLRRLANEQELFLKMQKYLLWASNGWRLYGIHARIFRVACVDLAEGILDRFRSWKNYSRTRTLSIMEKLQARTRERNKKKILRHLIDAAYHAEEGRMESIKVVSDFMNSSKKE